ncbi:primosomal protein N' [Candidatus Babeliales bacterium]|nr:primosomal protein N' [Candidatus Babeliales bacterium]
MYALVKVLKGFAKPLFYKIPSSLNNQNLIGKIVQVQLKNKITPALVLKQYKTISKNIPFKIKPIINIEKFPDDRLYHNFVEKISKLYLTNPLYFYKRIKNFLLASNREKKVKTVISQKILPSSEKNYVKKIILTNEQKIVVQYAEKFIDKKKYTPILLHGVTGSGKTEIYKKLIIKNIEKNKSIILLLPEVSLAIQFQFLLQHQLPKHISIIGFHSASKEKEKKSLWQKLINKKPIVIIGVHLPILLPISNLGLIIVDEEHELGFSEKKHPKINSKEVAIWRSAHYEIPIILGSATPCLNSLHNAKTKNWKFFQLKKRFQGNFPDFQLIFLKNKKTSGKKSFWISSKLENSIKQNLLKREQTIIYLNRRGYSFFIQCKKCGFIFQCPNCSVSLTLHKNINSQILRCHYCNHVQNIKSSCPKCNSDENNFLKKGIGTQQVVNILQGIFPQALIERADLDSAIKKRSWHKTLENFKKGKIDILVGTQLISKGYHFENVTLVGIIWADLNLHFPIFNSSETTLQKLIQVAGRTGRGNKKGKVIVQAIHDHQIFKYLNEQNYLNFCSKELELRKITKYPPFYRLIQIELKNKNTSQLNNDSMLLCQKFHTINKDLNLNIQILGPARPIVYRIQKIESKHIFLKTNSFDNFFRLIKNINFETFESKIFVVPTQ